MKQVHHYTAAHRNRVSRCELAVFGLVITLAAISMGLLCLSGCTAPGIALARPTQGGRLVVERPFVSPTKVSAEISNANISEPREILQFAQGDNANSPSSIKTSANGTMEVMFGTVEKPILATPPQSDYPTYGCLAAGIVFIGGGIALACSGWPQIGGRLLLAGLGMVVVALTVKPYGWAYVLGLGVLAGWIAWEKFHAYTIGLSQTVAQSSQV